MDFLSKIRSIEDFPKEGILFRDITTLLKEPKAYIKTIDAVAKPLLNRDIELIVGPEARGFVIGAPVAYHMGCGFIPARKPGKLPAETITYTYDLEYGQDSLQIHKDAVLKGQRVAVVDDLLATGGTALATAKMVEMLGGVVVSFSFMIELSDLGGREKLKGYEINTLVSY